MIRQTVLPFKLETTRDLVTPHAGLALLGEFTQGLGLNKALDWRPYRDGSIGETVHSMEKTKKAFRLLVVRRPYQSKLFDATELNEKYTVIATNLEGTAEEVLRW